MKYKITKKITQEVINEITKVKKEQGLTPETIVEQAKDVNSSLHDKFEWDNGKCGVQWRLQQARVLINEVKVIVENKEYFAFENVSVRVENSSVTRREYVTREEAITDENLRGQVIKRALSYLSHWKRQYKQYSEFQLILNCIDNTEKELNDAKNVEVKE